VSDLSGPLELHHAKGDESVPYEFSENLKKRLDTAGKSANLYLYEGDDHNLSRNFSVAMARSLQFFETHLKAAVASPAGLQVDQQ
jgi:predicted esterase